MGAGRQAPLQAILVIGRTLKESLSWVSRLGVGPEEHGLIVIFPAVLGLAKGGVVARAAFRTDEVKLRKGDVIKARLRSPSPIPCEVGVTTGSHQPQRARRGSKRGARTRKSLLVIACCARR